MHAQFDRILDALAEKLPAVAEHLDTARADLLAFTAFPKEIWRQIWSNNPHRGAGEMIMPVSCCFASWTVLMTRLFSTVRIGRETRGLGVSRRGWRAP